MKAQVLYLYGDFETALTVTEKNEKNLPFIAGQILVAEHVFYYALILTALIPEASPDKKEAYLQKLATNIEKLHMWKKHCKENFNQKYLLVLAEQAFLKNKPFEAMELYDQAIEEAQKNNFIQDEAIANELAGKFWISRGKKTFAHFYLNTAQFCFAQWGAKQKSFDLENRYPDLVGEKSCLLFEKKSSSEHSASESTALYLKTVIKASQAISSEVGLRNLLRKLMKIVLENAGAERGCLVMKKKGQYVVEAEMNTTHDTFHVLQATPIFQKENTKKAPL